MSCRFYVVICWCFLLSSCGGGKGCGPVADPSQAQDIYWDDVYVALGELTHEDVKDGVLVVEAQLSEDNKRQLASYLDNAKKQEDYEEGRQYYVHIFGYLEHEDHLNKVFKWGSDVYDYDDFFCSDVRLFLDGVTFPSLQPTDPIALGTIDGFKRAKQSYAEGSNFDNTDSRNPSAVVLLDTNFRGVGDDNPDFYAGKFSVRVEAGTSITKENFPAGKFFMRFSLVMSTYQLGLVALENHPLQTPKCGPYLQSNNAKDMGTDMPDMGDMASGDATPDMPEMSDMSVGDMGKDATQDMPTFDMNVDMVGDMPKDVGMD